MDWNLKAPWDFTELEESTLPNIGTGMVNGSNTRYGVNKTEGEFSVDLKLGQVGTSRNEALQNWKETGVSKFASAPSSGSSKRARSVNSGTQTVACLVDGCNSDLSNCRDYHRRHKVCEIHSKTPQVTICGQKQRFCQQCSRFHSLEEFDEGKRSCRKRLDGHNRRRRKPQPEPITRPATLLSSYQGSQLLPLATSHVYPSTSMVSPSWKTGVVITSGADARLQNQHHQLHLVDKHNRFMRSSGADYKESKQYTFLQEENSSLCNQSGATLQASLSHSLIRTHTNLSERGDQFRQKMFCDGLTSQGQDSHSSALSLLSSLETQTSDNGLNQMVQPDISLEQPLGLSLQDNHFDSVDSVLVSNANDGDTKLHGTGMYSMGTEESHGNEAAPQPFHFAWD